MIQTIRQAFGLSFKPYENLALEKYLLDHVEEHEVILYLWQNQRTVVCGRNQNLWKECHVTRLLTDGGHPARRLSGGGAVFHDMGNLNFTFLARKENYDLSRQLQVIIEACRSLDIQAEKNGRNDITVGGRKVSGNAFYASGDKKYHHGTLLVHVDTGRMSDYLNVDREKLASKGVASVRSRVANLTEFHPGLTIRKMEEEMLRAFEQVYRLPAVPWHFSAAAEQEIRENAAFFRSDQWLYGRKIDFAIQISRRFPWGDFDLRLNVEKGKITSAALYSDANDEAYIRSFRDALEGRNYSFTALWELAENLCETEEQKEMAAGIRQLLYESI